MSSTKQTGDKSQFEIDQPENCFHGKLLRYRIHSNDDGEEFRDLEDFLVLIKPVIKNLLLNIRKKHNNIKFQIKIKINFTKALENVNQEAKIHNTTADAYFSHTQQLLMHHDSPNKLLEECFNQIRRNVETFEQRGN